MRVEQRRRLLAEAAMRVMKRDGVGAVTTRAVTAEASMPHGAFHYCFRSKDELLAEVFRSDADAAFEAVSDVLGSGGDLRAGVDRALAAFWASTVDDRASQVVLCELSSLALRDPTLGELRRCQVEAYTARLTDALVALADQTGVRWHVDPDALAALLYSALAGITESWLALGHAALAEQQLALLADTLVNQADVAP